MTAWSGAPIIFVHAICCPRCKALRPIIVRSSPIEADGSRSRRCICRRCSQRFVVVIEPPGDVPDFGSGQSPSGKIEP